MDNQAEAVTEKKHLMIDIETLATTGRAIISIGFVHFNPWERDTFKDLIERGQHLVIQLSELLSSRPFISDRTLSWWMQQREAAREAIFGEQAQKEAISPVSALLYLDAAVHLAGNLRTDREIVDAVWSRGPLDFSMVNDAATYYIGREIIPFRIWRDLHEYERHVPQPTAEEVLASDVSISDAMTQVAHNALHDAAKQVMQLQQSWKPEEDYT